MLAFNDCLCLWFVSLFSASSRCPPKFVSNNDIICFMSTSDWAGLILTILSIVGIVGVAARWIVKKYVEEIMSELKPNSGSSLKDQVTRLEDKMDKLFDMMINHLNDHSKK